MKYLAKPNNPPRGQIAALRGARFIAYPIDMSRSLRSVRLSLWPLATVLGYARLFLLVVCLLPVFSYAGQATDLAADPVLEKRMIGLAENLRCLVCQNESLASSHAELAEDLRREVREQMKKGMNDQEIVDYLVSRYGDFVLYDPPVKRYTLVLWFGPFVLLLLGGGVLFYQLRKRKSQISEAELSEEDVKRAAELLNETPLPNPLPQAGEGANESLRDSRIKGPQA